MSTRDKIIHAFAEWTAYCATRSGCPLKARETVYPLIRTPNYTEILYGELISTNQFDEWHQRNTLAITEREPKFPVGWAAKIINIYLKTTVYLVNIGRPNLIECIHPPIDNELWKGIYQEYKNRLEIISKTHIVNRIKEINSYDKYKTIIEGCRLIAKDRGCYLVEVDELWQGNVV
jgi:hypothetical protein